MTIHTMKIIKRAFPLVAASMLALGFTVASAAPGVAQPRPEPTYPAWLYARPAGAAYNPDWAFLERCWKDRYARGEAWVDEQGRTRYYGTPVKPGCSPEEIGGRPRVLGCHWTVDYPSRWWVEQACGRIAGWPADFGQSWWQGWDEHPARGWVSNLRAGGQP